MPPSNVPLNGVFSFPIGIHKYSGSFAGKFPALPGLTTMSAPSETVFPSKVTPLLTSSWKPYRSPMSVNT